MEDKDIRKLAKEWFKSEEALRDGYSVESCWVTGYKAALSSSEVEEWKRKAQLWDDAVKNTEDSVKRNEL